MIGGVCLSVCLFVREQNYVKKFASDFYEALQDYERLLLEGSFKFLG